MTQLAVAMALYLALIAGLALHGLDMPDPTSTSSVSNQITACPRHSSTGSTENSLAASARPAVGSPSRKNKHHEPVSRKARRAAHQLVRAHAHCTRVRRIEHGGYQRLHARGRRPNPATSAGRQRGPGGVQAGARVGRVHRPHHRGGNGRAARPRQRLCRARRLRGRPGGQQGRPAVRDRRTPLPQPARQCAGRTGTRAQRSRAGADPGHARPDAARQQRRSPATRPTPARRPSRRATRSSMRPRPPSPRPGSISNSPQVRAPIVGPRRPRAGDGRQSRPGRHARC